MINNIFPPIMPSLFEIRENIIILGTIPVLSNKNRRTINYGLEARC